MPKFRIGVDASFWMEDDYRLQNIIKSEKAGFDTLWLGDHFLPWHHSFKHSFYAWSVIPTALERTSDIIIGVDVTVPIGARYHPAIIAQASGTIGKMYPGRFYLGVGTGEAMSEERFLGAWPKWQERIERLDEAVKIIDRLFVADDFIDFDGKYFPMKMVHLYVKPAEPPPIYYSALGPNAAYHAGRSGKNLMTVCTISKWREQIFPSFEKGAREAGIEVGRLDKSMVMVGSIGHRREAIEKSRRMVAGATIPGMFDESDPRKIEEAGKGLSDEDISSNFPIAETADEMIGIFDEYRHAGITHIIYTDLGPSPEETMQTFSRTIIPYFRELERQDG